MREPNFLYVGQGRAGSAWLFEVLREHPEVFVPIARDIYYFDRYYHLGFDWYMRHFEPARDEKAVGEVCHDYCLSELYARRIYERFPDAKILYCAREPIDLALAMYCFDINHCYHFTRTQYDTMSFLDIALHYKFFPLMDHYHRLEPFYRLFPRENIYTYFYDEIMDEPQIFVRKLYRFLGVDPEFVPSSLTRRVNPARYARFRPITEFANKTANWLRDAGQPNAVGAVKAQPWIHKLLYKTIDHKTQRPQLDAKTYAFLYEILHRNDSKLEALLGKSLPDSWRPRV